MDQVTKTNQWSGLTKIIFRFLFLFVLLFILTVPFPHTYLPDTGKYTSPFFEIIVKWLAVNVFNIHYPYTASLVSDSTGLYIHSFFLLMLAAAITLVWSITDRHRRTYTVLQYCLVAVASYYLALQLFTYGFSKVFKAQFYLPEPNTLYTTFGNLPPDLAYWSVMGASRMYSMFLGLAEVLAAILLLFKRTRIIAAFLAAGILLNIVVVNLAFDISVKLYSAFLFLLSVIVAVPGIKMLYMFVVFKKFKNIEQWKPVLLSRKDVWIYRMAKAVIVAMIVTDAVGVYIRTSNFDDDAMTRPFLHGGYEVKTFVINGDTLPPMLTDTMRWKKVFVHRAGYFIRAMMNDKMQDYILDYDTLNHQLELRNYHDQTVGMLHYSMMADSVLLLNGEFKSDTLQLYLRKLDVEKLPLLQKSFHWRMDE